MINLITLTEPRSPVAEAYLSLRTNLEFSSLEQLLHSILVTSVDDTTDKSVALANLAVVMAQAGDKVTLVDGDLRRPQQHEIFGLDNHAGLATWLDGVEESPPLQTTVVDSLRVLTSGPVPPNPVTLLSHKRLSELLVELTAESDYVLVDAPPVMAVTDAALWASRVDGTVLLVNAGRTKREHAQRAKAVLERVHARIVGSVLLNAEQDSIVSGYGV